MGLVATVLLCCSSKAPRLLSVSLPISSSSLYLWRSQFLYLIHTDDSAIVRVRIYNLLTHMFATAEQAAKEQEQTRDHCYHCQSALDARAKAKAVIIIIRRLCCCCIVTWHSERYICHRHCLRWLEALLYNSPTTILCSNTVTHFSETHVNCVKFVRVDYNK